MVSLLGDVFFARCQRIIIEENNSTVKSQAIRHRTHPQPKTAYLLTLRCDGKRPLPHGSLPSFLQPLYYGSRMAAKANTHGRLGRLIIVIRVNNKHIKPHQFLEVETTEKVAHFRLKPRLGAAVLSFFFS